MAHFLFINDTIPTFQSFQHSLDKLNSSLSQHRTLLPAIHTSKYCKAFQVYAKASVLFWRNRHKVLFRAFYGIFNNPTVEATLSAQFNHSSLVFRVYQYVGIRILLLQLYNLLYRELFVYMGKHHSQKSKVLFAYTITSPFFNHSSKFIINIFFSPF